MPEDTATRTSSRFQHFFDKVSRDNSRKLTENSNVFTYEEGTISEGGKESISNIGNPFLRKHSDF